MNSQTLVIRGKLHWAKVIGEPRLNTFTNEREWSVDLTPDEAGYDKIKKAGIKDRLRDPKEGDSRDEEFLTLRQKEYRKDPKTGELKKNRPIKIVDIEGKEWGGALLGNETVADVKIEVKGYGPGKPKGVYIQAIRVLDLVQFASNDFAPLSDDDEFYGAAPANPAPVAQAKTPVDADPSPDNDIGETEDLDDEIPF